MNAQKPRVLSEVSGHAEMVFSLVAALRPDHPKSVPVLQDQPLDFSTCYDCPMPQEQERQFTCLTPECGSTVTVELGRETNASLQGDVPGREDVATCSKCRRVYHDREID